MPSKREAGDTYSSQNNGPTRKKGESTCRVDRDTAPTEEITNESTRISLRDDGSCRSKDELASLPLTRAYYARASKKLVVMLKHRAIRIGDFNGVLPVFCLALFIGIWAATGSQPEKTESQSEINTISLMGQYLFFYLNQTFIPLDQALFYPLRAKQGYNVGTSNNILPFVLYTHAS